MIPVLYSARPIARRYRIYRQRATPAGWALDNVSWSTSDSLSIHAPDAETALERAKKLLPAWACKGLVAVSEES